MKSLALVAAFLAALVLGMIYLKPGCPDCHCKSDPPMCCCGGVCKPLCACPTCNCKKPAAKTKGCN